MTDRSELYGYDQRHRLVTFDRGTITSGSNPTLSAALADADILAAQDWAGSGWDGLDRRGNWTRTDRTVGTTPVTTPETRVANAVNLYTSIDLDGAGSGAAVTPEHDRRGNLTKDPSARNIGDGGSPTGQKFEYDEENRLVTVRRASDNATLLTIKYDALGRRAESTDYVCAGQPCGTSTPVITRHVFDGIQTTQEYTKCPSQSWALAREFVWGDRFPQPLALIAYGGGGGYGGSGLPSGTNVYHYLHDVLGSVVALTRSDGKVVERYTYDPYGRTVIEQTDPNSGLPVTRSDASVFGNPFAWTGQRYDGGVRLWQFPWRWHSGHLGRWIQRDSLGYVDGPSLYEYVGSSPVAFVDPLGFRRQRLISRWTHSLSTQVGPAAIELGEPRAGGDRMLGISIVWPPKPGTPNPPPPLDGWPFTNPPWWIHDKTFLDLASLLHCAAGIAWGVDSKSATSCAVFCVLGAAFEVWETQPTNALGCFESRDNSVADALVNCLCCVIAQILAM